MIIWTIPQKITQGDRITWTQNLAGFDSAFDTLSCFLRGQNSALDLTGTPLLLAGLKQKSSPNKPQTSFISYKYVTILVEP